MCHAFRLICCLTVLTFPVLAQQYTGVFTGQVTDAGGAVIPNAVVTIVNAETGVQVYSGKSNEQGLYLAPSMRPGVYNLLFEAPGFKRAEVRGVNLLAAQRAGVDVVLQAGALTETVTVVGENVAALEKESSAQDEIFNYSQVQNLPLANRNFMSLLTLVAGAAHTGDPADPRTSGNLTVNGSRPLNNEVAVEGVSALTGINGGTTPLPSTESIREVKVLTAAFSAEYGRTAGGYINAIVNSGTKEFHGGAYEYLRNEALNANDYFNNARRIKRPVERYHQFGFKIGGPLWLPRFGEGGPVFSTSRERTFFFLNYEGLRNSRPSTPTFSLPDAQFRAGDFSASPILIRDPLRAGNCTASDRTACFPGNRIPDNRIDPAARRAMNELPLPNSTGTLDAVNGRFINNYVNPQTVPQVNNEINTRIDHSAYAGRTRIFGRYYMARTTNNEPIQIPGLLNPGFNAGIWRNYQANLGYTQIVSSSIISEANLGVMRFNPATAQINEGINVPAALGIARAPTGLAPRFQIAGYPDLGTVFVSFRRQITNTYQPSGSLSWTRGGNLLKAGVQLRKNQFNVINPGGGIAGVYSFSGEITSPARAANNPVNALADFLLGQIKTSFYELPQPLVGRRNYNLGLFAQDDWKVTPRLTLNLGLRWEYESPMTEVNNFYSRIDARTGCLFAAGRKTQCRQSPGIEVDNTLNLKRDKNNFAPRAGFAYSLNDKTVIRSAIGVFYWPLFGNLSGAVNFPGFSVRQSFANLGAGVAQPFTLSQGMPLLAAQNLNDPFFIEREATINNALAASLQFEEITPLPATFQVSFGVQRELGGGVIVEANYVGARGIHLPLDMPYNQIPFAQAEAVAFDGTTAARQNARPFPLVDGFSSRVNAVTSTFHSLQLKGQRQFNRNLSFLATYTWAKGIDNGSGIDGGAGQPNGLDIGQYPSQFLFLERAVSSLDLTHNFAVAVLYTTKFGPRWLQDFQINPIVIARSGFPDTITQTNLNPAVTQQRPSLKGASGNIYAANRTPEGTGIRYLLAPTDANFPLAPTGPLFVGAGANRRLVLPASIGTLGRNTIREPGEFKVDLSLSKRFPITERFSIHARAEAFNLFNRVNFNEPSSALTVTTDAAGNPVFNSPGFGLITSAKKARLMQIVLRIEF